MGPLKSMGPRASAHRAHGLRWPWIRLSISPIYCSRSLQMCCIDPSTNKDVEDYSGNVIHCKVPQNLCTKFTLKCNLYVVNLMSH